MEILEILAAYRPIFSEEPNEGRDLSVERDRELYFSRRHRPAEGKARVRGKSLCVRRHGSSRSRFRYFPAMLARKFQALDEVALVRNLNPSTDGRIARNARRVFDVRLMKRMDSAIVCALPSENARRKTIAASRNEARIN